MLQQPFSSFITMKFDELRELHGPSAAIIESAELLPDPASPPVATRYTSVADAQL